MSLDWLIGWSLSFLSHHVISSLWRAAPLFFSHITSAAPIYSVYYYAVYTVRCIVGSFSVFYRAISLFAEKTRNFLFRLRLFVSFRISYSSLFWLLSRLLFFPTHPHLISSPAITLVHSLTPPIRSRSHLSSSFKHSLSQSVSPSLVLWLLATQPDRSLLFVSRQFRNFFSFGSVVSRSVYRRAHISIADRVL